MQFAKKSKNIYSYAFLIMMYVQMIVYQVWPYQFFPGKYIWVFYFPSYDLIISGFFIQLYKINFFHIVFVIHIVVIIFWNMKIRCFYWYSNYKDVSAWQKLQCVPFCLVSLTLYRHLPYLTFFFTLACFMADWLADDILERGKRHSIDNTVQLISKPPDTSRDIFVDFCGIN